MNQLHYSCTVVGVRHNIKEIREPVNHFLTSTNGYESETEFIKIKSESSQPKISDYICNLFYYSV